MAIVQISQITQRKGLQIDLPQLAGAEFGWSIDERRLFIGNGTLAEGAPVVGNTEILTEFSDILEFTTTYTYKGLAAGYQVQTGPTIGTPITQSLQSWLDQFATVKDFGAVGDGVTDDTDAINRALYELYCRDAANPEVRRALFFPAGVYRITGTVVIPPFAMLYGEGKNASVIQADMTNPLADPYVIRTGDSLQQTGVNIGSNGALPPQSVTVSNMGFMSDGEVNVCFIEDLDVGSFNNVLFGGPLTQSDLVVPDADIAGVRIDSTVTLISNNITFDRCEFTGLTYGINSSHQSQGVTVSNSKFDTLYRGIDLSFNTAPDNPITGFRIVHNFFDNIYVEGIAFGDISLNATGYNIFYDVGNQFQGAGNPATPVIDFSQSDNNISIGDMFERDDTDAVTYPRVALSTTAPSIAFTNGQQIQLGSLTVQSGLYLELINNEATFVDAFTLIEPYNRISIKYSIERNNVYRYGTIEVMTDGSTTNWYDDYQQTGDTGIVLNVTTTGGYITLQYTSTLTGYNADFNYSISTI